MRPHMHTRAGIRSAGAGSGEVSRFALGEVWLGQWSTPSLPSERREARVLKRQQNGRVSRDDGRRWEGQRPLDLQVGSQD